MKSKSKSTPKAAAKPKAKAAAKSLAKSTSKPLAKLTPKAEAPEASDAAAAAIDALIVRVGTGKRAVEARIALRALPAADKVPRLIAFFTDPRPKVRGNAYEMATSHPDSRALVPVEMLVAGANDPDRGVRNSILLCLNRGHGAKHEAAYRAQRETIRPALAKLLADPDPAIAKQAAIVWARLGLT